jgi:hypothetical protein
MQDNAIHDGWVSFSRDERAEIDSLEILYK